MVHSYMRDTVSNARVTCPCCLRLIMTKEDGTMVRHGWKEAGRQVGQWGCGYQWGSCLGWSKTPLETTDKDSLGILEGLSGEILRLSVAIQHHVDGEPAFYVEHLQVCDPGMYRFSSEETARKSAMASGLAEQKYKFTLEIQPDAYSRREGGVYQARIEVLKGDKGSDNRTKLPSGRYSTAVSSYTDLQARRVKQLERTLRELENAREAIKAAINTHRGNPFVAAETPKPRGPVVHLAAKWRGKKHTVGKCKQGALKAPLRNVTTEDRGKVTCKRCLKSMAS